MPTILRRLLEADLRRTVEDRLPLDLEAKADLRRRTVRGVTTVYFAWLERLIPARPRTVHTAPPFDSAASRLSGKTRHQLADLLKRIEGGDDLTQYLSKFVMSAAHTVVPPERWLRGRRHLDLLLFGWGIHHLHLREGGRGNELVLGFFRTDDAYLLNILDHRVAFGDVDLLRTAVRTWPDAELLHGSISGLDVVVDVTDDAADLRDRGISTIVKIDGRVYVPGPIGLTMGGYSMTAERRGMKLVGTLDALDRRLAEDPAHLEDVGLDRRRLRLIVEGADWALTDGRLIYPLS